MVDRNLKVEMAPTGNVSGVAMVTGKNVNGIEYNRDVLEAIARQLQKQVDANHAYVYMNQGASPVGACHLRDVVAIIDAVKVEGDTLVIDAQFRDAGLLAEFVRVGLKPGFTVSFNGSVAVSDDDVDTAVVKAGDVAGPVVSLVRVRDVCRHDEGVTAGNCDLCGSPVAVNGHDPGCHASGLGPPSIKTGCGCYRPEGQRVWWCRWMIVLTPDFKKDTDVMDTWPAGVKGWITGVMGDGRDVWCARVEAESADAARQLVESMYGSKVVEWSFIEERDAGWWPARDRFPR